MLDLFDVVAELTPSFIMVVFCFVFLNVTPLKKEKEQVGTETVRKNVPESYIAQPFVRKRGIGLKTFVK